MYSLFSSVFASVLVTVVLSSNVALALTSEPSIKGLPGPASRLALCHESCRASHEPGFELRHCISNCQRLEARDKAASEVLKNASLMGGEALALRCQYAPELCR